MIDALLKPGAIFEIVIFSVVIYALLMFFRGTRGATLIKGVIFLVVFCFVGFLYLAELGGLVHLKEVVKWLISGSTVALIVVFAPEIRRGLQKLAQSRILFPLFREHHSTVVIREIVEAVSKLSKNRVGALLAIERDVGLNEYVENAVKIEARLSSELLETIFYPGSALHDGAVIVRHDMIAAAGCLFPLSDDPDLAKSMGTRHRAGIGISEDTDAIVLIVSEETGNISLCTSGKLHPGYDGESLRVRLTELYLTEEKAEEEKPEKETPPGSAPPSSSSGNGSADETAVKQERQR
jgi:diadenylate cyclase